MKKLLTLALSVSLAFCIVGLFPVHSEDKIYDSVIRLHVVARSDSEEDQRLKICVRDAILQEFSQSLASYGSLEEAEKLVRERLDDIGECANECLASQGSNSRATVSLGYEEYPTRSYGSLCFPSGEYLSLRVIIDEGAGENWWCVLFPPLCLGAATQNDTNEDAFISVGFTPDQYGIITESQSPKYKARFKILEVIEDMLG